MPGKDTILIVDDEVDFLSSMRRLLRKEPYAVLTAESGKTALEILNKNPVNLVLSDYLMPGMDGLALLKKVRLQYPQIITIMLTALSELEIAMKAVNDAGVYKFFLKPVEHYGMRVALRRALEFQELIREKDDLNRKLNEYDVLFQKLENKQPGITHVELDESGCYVLPSE
jgi:two-component system, probable response regulator PhcQ